ncbi:MAG TPA: hypothetical protein PKD85_07675 [Saprospiraceae bacterium]|nr:hypothetical protein [Saprospiraceae bacterium]
MKVFNFLISIFLSNALFGQIVSYDEVKPLEDYNFVLGTQGIGGKYKFTGESALIEQARHIRSMGSNILKISLGKNAPTTYGLQQVNVNSTLELFHSSPDFKRSFDMDFKYIFAWVHTLTNVEWKKGINGAQEKRLYDEMYEFAAYILKEYNNTGKTFLIGNWEGDWLLHPNYKRDMTPPKVHTDNMTKWFNIRQKAIDDAKRKIKHNNVSLFHYIEVNLVLKGMDGKVCIANTILPNVDVDLVSYSSYEAIKNKDFETKKSALTDIFNYLEKKLKPKEGLPFSRRVFIGEYGYHANNKNPKSFEKQMFETKEIMQISLELDLPFALHWQMYNNEYDDKGNSKQMSLINEQGEKRPLYYFHKEYYQSMNEYLKEFKEKYKRYPSSKEFNIKALEAIQSMKI